MRKLILSKSKSMKLQPLHLSRDFLQDQDLTLHCAKCRVLSPHALNTAETEKCQGRHKDGRDIDTAFKNNLHLFFCGFRLRDLFVFDQAGRGMNNCMHKEGGKKKNKTTAHLSAFFFLEIYFVLINLTPVREREKRCKTERKAEHAEGASERASDSCSHEDVSSNCL